jgi:hypothetical protein
VENTYNTEWHNRNKLPGNAGIDQRVKWHIEHARRCPCGYRDNGITGELSKRYLGKHQDFWIDHNITDHRNLGHWIADVAGKFLPYFETDYPDDPRPVRAIVILRDWADTGIFSMNVIRSASLGSHSAARDTLKTDNAARYAARAAGQAVATAHAPTHAIGALIYCIKLLAVLYPGSIKAEVEKETKLQLGLLPGNLRPWVTSWIDKTLPALPLKIRQQLL